MLVSFLSRLEAFTNCLHGYNCAHNVHTYSVNHTWKFVHGTDYRPWCFKKITTTITTAFLISNTVVSDPFCQRKHSILNFSHPLPKFQDRLIDLFQSDNGIQQCVNRSWTEIFTNKFVVHGQYIRSATSLLISIYQKWQRCYVNRLRSVQEWRVAIM